VKKILSSVVAVSILFIGCSDESTKEVKATTNQAIDTVSQTTEDVTSTATKVVQKATQTTKEVVDKVTKSTAPIAKEVTTKTKDVVKKVSANIAKATENMQEKIHLATAPKLDGKTLFKVCSSCHGKKAQKKALNASHVIQGWSKEKVETALYGYQNGTYGGAMKGVMMGQAKSLDDAKISALAEYISTL